MVAKSIYLLSVVCLLGPLDAFSQTAEKKVKKEDHLKVDVYILDGKMYDWRDFDSLRFNANHYVGIKRIKDTEDSIYFSIVHFDKSFVADRYQTEGMYCGNAFRMPLEDIKKLYPYNKTVSVKVVSFKDFKLPMTNDRIDFTKMFEVKTLDVDLADKMFDILANYVRQERIGEVAFCWDPRNAVMLVDKDERVIACVEICFDCQQYKVYPKEVNFGVFCNEKLDAIQGIMMRAGIMYGMKREMD